MRPNYCIFEVGDNYWKAITRNGELEVPTYVKSQITADGILLEEMKHPIRLLEKGRWMVNYSSQV